MVHRDDRTAWWERGDSEEQLHQPFALIHSDHHPSQTTSPVQRRSLSLQGNGGSSPSSSFFAEVL